MQNDLPETVADDLLKGATAIGAFIGTERQRTFLLLQKGIIPAGQINREWVASKTFIPMTARGGLTASSPNGSARVASIVS
jgi:hypothetical protein